MEENDYRCSGLTAIRRMTSLGWITPGWSYKWKHAIDINWQLTYRFNTLTMSMY